MVSAPTLIVRLGIVAACAQGLAIPSTAFADDVLPKVLERAVGSWQGRGTAREANEDAAEPVACRATNAYTADSLKIAATCKSASGEGQLVAFIKGSGASSALSGVWYRNSTHLAAEERGDLAGAPKGSDAVALDVRAAGKTVARVGLSFAGANTMRLTVSEPPSDGGGVLLDVAFNR
jgi:hypothetical protein